MWGPGACYPRVPHSPTASHVVALLDSGSAGNFISGTLCRQLGLRTKATPTSYQIQSIIGKPISRRQVSRSTGPVLLQVGVLHMEEITLLVLEESMADVILGRPWLEQHNPILSWLLTDHKNLEYLRAAKRLNPRQARWALFFTQFNFTISYQPGSKNTKADTLSRMFAPEESPETPKPILPENIIVSPITWSEETLPPANASTNTPPGCPPGSQYIPRARRTALIHSAHTSLGTGHPGIHETLSLLKDRFWWPNMTADVRRYFSIPEDIVSDRGPQFISRVWRAFLTRLGVAVSLSSGYQPQTNGQTERKIQEISRYLRTFCHSHQNSWSQYLGWAEYAQNSLHQPSTGLTPFQCVLGYQPPLFPWSGEPSDVPAVDHWFRESERVWDSAHHQLQ
ncbi:hypothetical protein QTP70_007754 [Hemibagrus guttatus]|uniref:Gypsy retrotransposon integrase-like protein 1 n=1 Tax=Hemibagrus guttatus TaxID=175788 RepID=A0AAE0VAR4_9TELE|nr:hypothetical protein QTP70_007754 [Hemibagrus guttatus]